jgi:hypothetical protein
MGNGDVIRDTKSLLINIALSNISAASYMEFETAALKVINELKTLDRPMKGAAKRANT